MRRRLGLLAAAALAVAFPAPAHAGSLVRPLDPAKPHGRSIRIHYDWYAPRGKPSGRPLVAVEGGPGYPTTGSSVEYLGIFGPLVRQRGLLLVDNRGTGKSGLIADRNGRPGGFDF